MLWFSPRPPENELRNWSTRVGFPLKKKEPLNIHWVVGVETNGVEKSHFKPHKYGETKN